MIRDVVGSFEYWNSIVNFELLAIERIQDDLKKPSENSSYRPQYVFELCKEHWHLMLCRYSRGDAITDLLQYFPSLLDAWEESERLGKDVWTPQQQFTRHAWTANLDHYIVCFWLVGLALALNIPDDQWKRLVTLIGNEGEDALLDRVMSCRQPDRKIGSSLCHPVPYQRLLDTINATTEQQSALLAVFVDSWYAELDRPAKKGNAPATAMYERPYWYKLRKQTLEDSGYFGFWCIEAVAAVKAFNLDDSQCLGHPNYPGDLLRPNGPSTHPAHTEPEVIPSPIVATSSKRNWFARFWGSGSKKQ